MQPAILMVFARLNDTEVTTRDQHEQLDAKFRPIIGARVQLHPTREQYFECSRSGHDICPSPQKILYAERNGRKLSYRVWRDGTEVEFECDGDICVEK